MRQTEPKVWLWSVTVQSSLVIFQFMWPDLEALGDATTCNSLQLAFWQIPLHLARPCAADGSFFKEPVHEPEPIWPPDATPDNNWALFPDRLTFDWAQYHFICLQSSEGEIAEGLDLWCATVIKHASEYHANGHVPWSDMQDLYKMLDSIQAGTVGW
jgi:hypothetical protein